MKKLLLKVTSGPEYSFSFTKEHRPHFYDEFHYHPELELTLIIKGTGTRFIGDNIERFNDGDLILIGASLPHVWKCDREFYQKNTKKKCSSITIHFAYDFLGSEFFDRPELRKVKELLNRSSGGIKLVKKIRTEIAAQLQALETQSQAERLITFLDALRKISISKSYKILSSKSILDAYHLNDTTRIHKVHQHIISNFKYPIKLEEIAQTASLSTTAFCRYFKQRTGKSFSTFLTEVRVGYSCQLLQENKMKIAEICFESGFNNLSNFNRLFKSIMKTTPMQYRKEYHAH